MVTVPSRARLSPTGKTWLMPEEDCYPSGGILRRGRAILRQNPHNPIVLPYGEIRAVLAGLPETFFSISAKVRVKGQTVRGFLDVGTDCDVWEWQFTPNAPEPPAPFDTLRLDLDHSADDLGTFLATYKRGSAYKLFGSRRGAETALRHLRQYARAKLAGMRYRMAGDLRRAVPLEDAAERFYRMLPPSAKW